MTTAFNPAAGASGDVHIMSPGAASNGKQSSGQGQQSRPESSLDASASVSGAGPIISRIRQSRYSETEILLMLDGASLLLFAALVYMEVSN